jgi:hypothetical protein
MKKLISIIVISVVVLSLSSCGTNEVEKTEEELRAEVKAELEEEAALKDELRAEIEAELAAKDEAELTEEDNDEEKEEIVALKDDEIITTFAYKNLDGVDVSNLEEVVINAKDATENNSEYYKVTGDDYEYKVAIFGEVHNVKINYSSYIYEDYGVEMATYDNLKDTVLIIKSSQMNDFDGFFVSFEDGRGMSGRFILNDSYIHDEEPIELVSGFTAIEKTPSSYEAYDMADIIHSLGMTVDEFDNSEMMQYAEKTFECGMDDDYILYTMNQLAEGVTIRIYTQNNILAHCYIDKVEQDYDNMLDEEKYNFLGMDFDMSVVRANYNMVNPDDSIEVSVWGETPDSICSSLVLSVRSLD